MTERAALAKARLPGRGLRRERGGSLVGMMIGVTIGLLALLAVAQALTASQAHRRQTMGGSDAQQVGAIALWQLSRELRMAGAGLQAAPFAWGCNLRVGRDGQTLLPRTSMPAPFDALPNALRLQPIVVLDGGGTRPDQLVAMGGRPAAGNVPMALNVLSPTTVGTGASVGFAPGDLLLATAASGVDDCFVGQVDSSYLAPAGVPAPSVLPTGPAGAPFNLPATLAGLAGDRDWMLLNLGATPSFSAFGVSAAAGLVQLDLLMPGAVPVPIAENVINLQVLLGVDDGSGGGTADDNVIDGWVSPASAPYDFATMAGGASATSQLRVKALRVALVVRASERGGNSPTTITLFGDVAGRALTVPVPDRTYRYQVYDAVVPLRAQWIALCSEQRRAAGIPKNGACG